MEFGFKITKQNGGVLDDDARVEPVNLFLHSLFSQVDMSPNGTQMTASTNTYPYRAMLETLRSLRRRCEQVAVDIGIAKMRQFAWMP